MSWRERFGMSGPPLPRGAAGETFFDQSPHFRRLARVFDWLTAEPGISVVIGEPGVGKTSAMRHLCRALPLHEHRVLYLADTNVKPLDLYRMLAAELGLRPGLRAQIVSDIKRALVTLVDERSVVPILVLDDAQALRDDVLHELHGLTCLDFDTREYLTVWLVGHLRLDRRLRLQQHTALAQRVVSYVQLSSSAPCSTTPSPPPPRRPTSSRPTPANCSCEHPAASRGSSATSSASPSSSPTNAATARSTSPSSTPPPSSYTSITPPPPSCRRSNPVRNAVQDHGDNATRHNAVEQVPVPDAPDLLIPYIKLRVLEETGILTIHEVVGTRHVEIDIAKVLNGVEFYEQTNANKVFVGFADDDKPHKIRLERHLAILQRQGVVASWADHRVPAGSDRVREVSRRVHEADILLLLVSSDLLSSEFLYGPDMAHISTATAATRRSSSRS